MEQSGARWIWPSGWSDDHGCHRYAFSFCHSSETSEAASDDLLHPLPSTLGTASPTRSAKVQYPPPLIHFLLSNQGSAEWPAIKGRIVLPMINKELTIVWRHMQVSCCDFSGLRRLWFEV
jgi:hypothetical protein